MNVGASLTAQACPPPAGSFGRPQFIHLNLRVMDMLKLAGGSQVPGDGGGGEGRAHSSGLRFQGPCLCKLFESPQISMSAPFWQPNLTWTHKRKTMLATRKHLFTRPPSRNQGPATGPTEWPSAWVLEPLEPCNQLCMLGAGPDSAWGEKPGSRAHMGPVQTWRTPPKASPSA